MSKFTSHFRAYITAWRTALHEFAEGVANLRDNPLPAALMRQHAARAARRGCISSGGKVVLSILALLAAGICGWLAVEVFSAGNSADAIVLGRINALASTSVMVVYAGILLALWLVARILSAVQFSTGFLGVRPGGSAAFDQLDDMVAISHLNGGDILAAALSHALRLLRWPLAGMSVFLSMGGGEYIIALVAGDASLLPEYGGSTILLRLLTAVLMFVSGMLAMGIYCALALHAGRMDTNKISPVAAAWVVVIFQLQILSMTVFSLNIGMFEDGIAPDGETLAFFPVPALLVLVPLLLTVGFLLLAPEKHGLRVGSILLPLIMPVFCGLPTLIGIGEAVGRAFGVLSLGAIGFLQALNPLWAVFPAMQQAQYEAVHAHTAIGITAIVFQLVIAPVALFLAHGSVNARRHSSA